MIAIDVDAKSECVDEKRIASDAGPRVIVVDDIPAARKLIRRILESEGYDVVAEAENGDEAVILSKELVPELIIMDYYMDGMNGGEAAKRIKKANPLSKIVMITGMPRPSLVLECFRAGAINFVMKPIQSSQLLNVANTATGHVYKKREGGF